MPVNAVLDNAQIKQLSKHSDEIHRQYLQLVLRARILDGQLVEDPVDEDAVYEAISALLFQLKFKEAKFKVDDWKPKSGNNKMRRLLLLSVLGDETREAITQLICQDNFDCLQDYKFAIDILPHVRGVFSKGDNGLTVYGDYQTQIANINKHNPKLIKVGKIIDDLLNEIKAKTSSQPYGNKKNVIHFDSYNIAKVNSIKIVQILLELGMPTEVRNVMLINKKDWPIICDNLFESYPYPCLYFSLLYGNSKDILRRIAQNYIYSYKLYGKLPSLLENMLNALLDDTCPENVKEAIYIVVPIFMKAVDSDCWGYLFEQIYDKFDLEKAETGRMLANEECDFITTGAKLTRSDKLKHKILLSNLQLQSEIRSFHNSLIIEVVDGISLNSQECDELNKLIEVAETPAQFYILINLHKWIDTSALANRLASLPDETYDDCTLLEAASQYAKDNAELHGKLKRIILQSLRLWQTGIDDNCSSVSRYGYTLDICYIQQHITFSKEEIIQIYHKMTDAYNKVNTITIKWKERKPWNAFNDWSFILIEMQNFMRQNESVLASSDHEYNTIRRAITRLLNQGRGGNKISSLLIDDNTNQALSWLTEEITTKGVASFQHEYILLANKILYRESQYLNSCFVHFSWALEKYSQQYNREIFLPLVRNILDAYKPYFIGNSAELEWKIKFAEKDRVEQALIQIYNTYKHWGGRFSFWDKYRPRYYN